MTEKPKPILIDIRAAELLFAEKPKPAALKLLAGLIDEQVGDDATYEDFQCIVKNLKQTQATHFVVEGQPVEKLSASALLEKSNREAATKFKAREQAPSKLILTDKEREKVAKMSADEKHAFANAKNKQAADVKKS